MPHALVTVTHRYFTAIPKDVAVNTFHFDTGSASVRSVAEELALLTMRFFNAAGGGITNAVGAFLSPIIPRTDGYQITRVYDMTDPKPRVPVHTEELRPPVSLNSLALPLETSVCNSFSGQALSGVPGGRRRGRVFIGPLNGAAITNGAVTTFPVVATTIRTALEECSQRLAVESVAAATPWCVYSRVSSALHPVVSGWIDNEPDTQRSRQASPTDRVVWSLSV